jgi:hypothetical protein
LATGANRSVRCPSIMGSWRLCSSIVPIVPWLLLAVGEYRHRIVVLVPRINSRTLELAPIGDRCMSYELDKGCSIAWRAAKCEKLPAYWDKFFRCLTPLKHLCKDLAKRHVLLHKESAIPLLFLPFRRRLSRLFSGFVTPALLHPKTILGVATASQEVFGSLDTQSWYL